MVSCNGVNGSGSIQGPHEAGKNPTIDLPEAAQREINPNAQVYTLSNPAAAMARIAMQTEKPINRQGIQNLFDGLQRFNAYCDFATSPSAARIAKEVFYP